MSGQGVNAGTEREGSVRKKTTAAEGRQDKEMREKTGSGGKEERGKGARRRDPGRGQDETAQGD